MIKKFIIVNIIIFIIFGIYNLGFCKECKDCPSDKPCAYKEKSSDGCNTCTVSTWCENDVWYIDENGPRFCTVMFCPKTTEISKPIFED